MKIKNKILVALLSIACMSGGALAFTACDNEDTPKECEHTYSTEWTDGETSHWHAATCEHKDLKTDEAPHDTDGENDTCSICGHIKNPYTVTCVDQDGKPVAGVRVIVSYYDKAAFVTVTTAIKGTTDANGEIILAVPDELCEQPLRVGLEDSNSAPAGYELNLGTEGGFAKTTVTFEDGKAKLTFKSKPNSFTSAVTNGLVKEIPYSRYPDGDKITETNGTANGQFKIDVKKDIYTYISFTPYIAPDNTSGSTDGTLDENIKKHTSAAAGIYEMKVEASNPLVFKQFLASMSGYTNTDENGVPVTTLKEANLANGTATLEIELKGNEARTSYVYAVLSDSDQQITFTVTRTGDVEEEEEIQVIKAEIPANIAVYPEKKEGETLTLMPLSSLTVVKGTDGYYHVNTADGPILLVQLKNAVSRFANESLENLPNAPAGQGVLGEGVYIITSNVNGKTVRIDYNDFLKAFCAKANKDGVYGVTEEIRQFLEALASTGMGYGFDVNAPDKNWLLTCQYYSPEGGLIIGNGTESNPQILLEGNNTVKTTAGVSYLKYSTPSKGVYMFNLTGDAEIECTNEALTSTLFNGVFYVCVNAKNTEITLKVTGNEASYALNVAPNASNRTLSAYFGDNTEGNSTVGTPDKPVMLTSGGVFGLTVDPTVQNGVYVRFTPRSMSGINYWVIELNSAVYYNTHVSQAQLYVNNKLVASAGKKYYIEADTGSIDLFFTSVNKRTDSNYMFTISPSSETEIPEDPEPDIDDSATLNLGEKKTFSYDGTVKYLSFIAPESGTYTVTLSDISSDNGMNNAFFVYTKDQYDFKGEPFVDSNTGTSGVVTLEADEVTVFAIEGWEAGKCSILIEQGGTLENEPLILGQNQLALTKTYETKLTVEKDGIYTFTFSSRIGLPSELYVQNVDDDVTVPSEKANAGNNYTVELSLTKGEHLISLGFDGTESEIAVILTIAVK